MKEKIKLNAIYKPSEDVVIRNIQGEFLLIPITNGTGNLEESIFSLNKYGRAIWDRLDGKLTLKKVVDSLALKYEAPLEEIEKDCFGLMEELLKRNMVVILKDAA